MQVSFIIAVYNQLALTRTILDQLKATLPPSLDHEIILVDDGSMDSTHEFLRELGPPHVVVRNPQNQGYACSNNRAARLARGEILALLNNDLVLQPGWFEPMLAAFTQHPRPGLLGNIQLNARTLEVDHAGIVFHQGGYPIHFREGSEDLRARGELIEMPAVTAACCLVGREWFCRAGGFDEGYRNGFEDVDLCLRAREDGLINLVATTSVVHHHISQSEGRDRHEFRNARRFLARWGPRAAALEKERDLAIARTLAAAKARQYFSPFIRRVGFGPRALQRQHRKALRAEQHALLAATRPVRVGVDLLRMHPGGANGGVKPLVYSFLAEIGRQKGAAFNFAILADKALRDELAPLLRPDDFLLEAGSDGFVVSRRTADGWKAAGSLALDTGIAAKAGLDVLYAPFGVSQLMVAGLPCISLVVDLLHRDLPAALPIEEVNFRHESFVRIAAEATHIQCISHHVINRMVEHYGVHPSRCFHTYIPAHDRLLAPAPDSPSPTGVPDGPFFFYPANFWPHKNHESLLVAYRHYAVAAGSRAWPLVLTGSPDARMELVREMSAGLGLADRVHFPGHLDDAAFAALWSRAGALVFPSLHEGFGIPLLEAMRFQVPIIANSIPVLAEVGGDSILLVDTRDPVVLAEAMRRVAIRSGLRADLATRGSVRLSAFSLALEAGRLAHFLETAARRRAP